tara:strand:+ start:337 stop:1059 length:723 start_codon:yes stop_codon:yes gene_type:complete
MNGYDLSRNFVNFSFENPSKIKPNHYALYFFAIEHCNRLGWKKEYGLPTTMTMEAIGIKSYNTYIKTFNELVDFGFFNLIERSKNQYSANIIELSNNDKAHDKALDKAFIKHATKQRESTQQSIDSINKPITSKPITTIDIDVDDIFMVDYLPKYKTYCNKILKDSLILENLNRMHKISMNNDVLKNTIHKYLKLFLSQISISQEKHENLGKFNGHFSNYLRKQPKIELVSIKQKEQRYV